MKQLNNGKKLKLKKRLDRIKEREWKRASKYYNHKFQLELARLQAEHKKDIQLLYENEKILYNQKLSSHESKSQRMLYRYEKFNALLIELEIVRDDLMPFVAQFQNKAELIFQQFAKSFDKIERIALQSKKLKKKSEKDDRFISK